MAGFAPLEAGDPGRAGPYQLVGRLGSGGMGRVYLARSPGGRTIAVKVVREEFAGDPRFRQRFAREVSAARRVTGFFTAAVVDADPKADPPWLATAYVPGLSLAEAVAAHGPWPEKPVLALGTALAEALESIHGEEVVHRDLKPSNVLLADDGPRLIDFGISVAADDTRLTLAGTAIGTPGYMSPEQLVGSDVGPACDVFALGAVLTYAATGTGPFAGGSAHGVNYRVVHEEPNLSHVPARLADVVARCLAKDPRQRPSVPELVEELGQFSADGRTAGVFTRSDWLPTPVATEITRIQNTPLPETTTGTMPLKAPPVGVVPASRPWGLPRRHARISLALAAALAVLAATLLLPDGLLNRDRSNAQDKETAAPARKLAFEELWTYEKDPVYPPAVSDGKVYFGDHGGTLHALNTDNGTPVWSYDGLKGVGQLAVVDGAVYGSNDETGTLHSVDSDTGEKLWSFEVDREFLKGGLLSFAVAKGTVYVFSKLLQGDHVLYALDAQSGKELWNRTVGNGVSPLVVADGKIYCGLLVDYKNYLYALDADTGDRLWRIKTGDIIPGTVTSIAVAGSTVYFGNRSGTFYAADTAKGAVRWTYQSEIKDAEWIDPPFVADGVVYAGVNKRGVTEDGPGHAYAFAANSGKPLWEYRGAGAVSPPVLTGGAIHFSDAGTLRALNSRTGKSLGSTALTTGADPRLTVSGDRAYFDGADGRLHAGRISRTGG
ncbi:serine/threonine-protein kinase [Streptomyces sp. NBC_01003]|uniref:outer membrane protein assembly factor BamB family protein n=1 Tax=Streptomyces sp. NBC_01003 TaxID=2903714 RepID=UPI003864BD23|nr:serine/threonine-protein kinase [Streptomyces sp. NBC_01003]